MKDNSKRGFSLIEVLVTIFILTLVTTIVVYALSKLNFSQALDKNTALVTSVLDQARSLTLAAKDDSEYGIYFQANEVVLFKGAVYSSSSPTNIVTVLDNRVGIRNIFLNGGGTTIVFKRLTGETDDTGTIELFLQSSTTTKRTITISATGIVTSN